MFCGTCGQVDDGHTHAISMSRDRDDTPLFFACCGAPTRPRGSQHTVSCPARTKVPAPLHPFEVRITIGANTREYIVDTLRELAADFAAGRGGMASGGWNGSHSVTVAARDITPEQYRAELREWADRNS